MTNVAWPIPDDDLDMPASLIYFARSDGVFFAVVTDDLGKYGQGFTLGAAFNDIVSKREEVIL